MFCKLSVKLTSECYSLKCWYDFLYNFIHTSKTISYLAISIQSFLNRKKQVIESTKLIFERLLILLMLKLNKTLKLSKILKLFVLRKIKCLELILPSLLWFYLLMLHILKHTVGHWCEIILLSHQSSIYRWLHLNCFLNNNNSFLICI